MLHLEFLIDFQILVFKIWLAFVRIFGLSFSAGHLILLSLLLMSVQQIRYFHLYFELIGLFVRYKHFMFSTIYLPVALCNSARMLALLVSVCFLHRFFVLQHYILVYFIVCFSVTFILWKDHRQVPSENNLYQIKFLQNALFVFFCVLEDTKNP